MKYAVLVLCFFLLTCGPAEKDSGSFKKADILYAEYIAGDAVDFTVFYLKDGSTVACIGRVSVSPGSVSIHYRPTSWGEQRANGGYRCHVEFGTSITLERKAGR